MELNRYKRQLIALEKRLTNRIDAFGVGARAVDSEGGRDIEDESVRDEEKDRQFAEAQASSVTLKEVQDALKRIENGTFGKCLVDGKPIETKRLDAMPWTAYCIEHERRVEGA